MIATLLILAAATVPEPALAPLLERIRLTVPDAREIRDLQLCPPRQISRDGRRFDTFVSLARPREVRQYYIATWRDGRVVKLSLYPLTTASLAPGGNILDQIAMRAMQRQFENCRWVSAAQLAAGWALLDGERG